MITLKTYNYNGEPNRLIKALQANEEYQGLLNGQFNVLHPVVRFRVETPVTFNYAYIEELNRYYFVDEISQDGNICTVRLSVDVLYTYRDAILKGTGTITKGEDTDKYVSNRETIHDVRPVVKRFDFPNKGLLNETGSIIMVTIKGNK